MAWVLVILAGLLEVAMALSLKASDGFSRLQWTLSFLVCAVASFTLLSLGLRTLPVGSAYAVWTGIGAAGTAIIGMLLLGDGRDLVRVAAIACILAGVVTLQVAGGGH